MKIFLSWSGETSKAIASKLSEWLPRIFIHIETFHSSRDISAGAQWLNVLFGQLRKSDFSIICLTPENRESKWLLFESGALLRGMNSTKVVPYCFGIKKLDLEEPLKYLQGVLADHDGTFKLLQSINKIHKHKISDNELRDSFNNNWPLLDKALKKITKEHELVRVRNLTFRQIITGFWWERMFQADNSAISFMKIEPDPILEGNIRLSGKAYNMDSEPWANWESEISGINPKIKKLYYKWKGWFPSKPNEPFEGFGEITFEQKAGKINSGNGSFYNINITNISSVTKKAFKIKRCTLSEIEIMERDDDRTIKSLIKKKLKK